MNREAVQRERLKNVLGFLREKGTTQREVADAIGEGEETLSRACLKNKYCTNRW